MRPDQFDALVLGAGPVGSAAALFLAQAGLEVALVEQRALDQAGPRWINAIPPRFFQRVGLPLPVEPELVHPHPTYAFMGKNGTPRLRIRAPYWDLDMPRFTSRLQGLAREAGVACFERAGEQRLTLEQGRPVALELLAQAPGRSPEPHSLRARLWVDATGLSAWLRRRVPRLAADCPPVPGQHLCTAAQRVYRVRDADGARAFLQQCGGAAGESLVWSAVEGAWSVTQVNVRPDLGTVSLLVGGIAQGHPPASERLAAWVAGQPWVGQPLAGGAGLIPLRRPYARLVAPGAALLGDAACQVFPMHASGVGAGLLAARQLADAVRDATDPGDEHTLWRYATTFQREAGAMHAIYDQVRRAVQALTPAEALETLDAGLLSAPAVTAGMDQLLPPPTLALLTDTLSAVLRAPRLAARLAPLGPRAAAQAALFQAYPPTPAGFPAWQQINKYRA
jgi:flavin-dependent dehydrogenase